MYAPLFSVWSQYLGAEKTGNLLAKAYKQMNLRLTSDALSAVLLLVAIHADFVAANDGVEPVVVAESLGDIGAELHAHSALARASARHGLGVCPKHLHHQTGLAGLPLGVSV